MVNPLGARIKYNGGSQIFSRSSSFLKDDAGNWSSDPPNDTEVKYMECCDSSEYRLTVPP